MKIDYAHDNDGASANARPLDPPQALVSFGAVDLEVKASWVIKPLDTTVRGVSFPEAFHGAVYFDHNKEPKQVSFSLKLTQGDAVYYLNNCDIVKPDEEMLKVDPNLTWGVEFGFTTTDKPYSDPFGIS